MKKVLFILTVVFALAIALVSCGPKKATVIVSDADSTIVLIDTVKVQ